MSYAQDSAMTTEYIPVCTGSLSQSDVDDSFLNPCPQYFDPLPSQGALSGSSLTIFGFPVLVDFSGSIVAADGTSTTYALTCQSSDVVELVGGQCTASGVVVPFTASGWNWHVTTTQSVDINFYQAVSMTATIDPALSISFHMVATGTEISDSSIYPTTFTWTGDVALANPTVVPIVGLAKIGGSDISSSSVTSAMTSGSTSRKSGAKTSRQSSSAATSSAGTPSKGAAASSTSIGGLPHGYGTWIALVGGSVAVGMLAIGL